MSNHQTDWHSDTDDDDDHDDYEEDDDEQERGGGQEPRTGEDELISTAEKAKAIEHIKSNFKDDATANNYATEKLTTFMTKFPRVVQGFAPGRMTILHTIIKEMKSDETQDPLQASTIRPLFDRIVKEFPNLLAEKDAKGRTPLYRAIHYHRRASTLVDCILDNCDDERVKKYVDKALELRYGTSDSKKTCLTLAFENNMDANVLQRLVKHASEDALKLQDSAGKTPLHYAVNYENCTDQRVEIIKLFLKRDQEIVRLQKSSNRWQPISTFLDITYTRKKSGKEPIEVSAYGELERTFKEHQKPKRPAKKTETAVKQTGQSSRVNGLNGNGPTKTDHKPKAAKSSKVPTVQDENLGASMKKNGESDVPPKNDDTPALKSARVDPTPKQLRHPKDRPDEAVSDKLKSRATTNGLEHAPILQLKKVGTQGFDIGHEEVQEKSTPCTDEASSSRQRTSGGNYKRVQTMLKTHYMRERTVKMAISFLYGKNVRRDKLICFEYDGPSVIRDDLFKKRLGEHRRTGVRFEDVLMYVRFPKVVTVERVGKQATAPDRGRQDMNFFFEWLYEKGVRYIIKVEVDDTGKKAHSDDTIRKALGQIVVEHLDWRKPDLDPSIICHIGNIAEKSKKDPLEEHYIDGASSSIRRVSLKWTGGNAVLRAWGEPEGLPQLPELTDVFLHLPAPTEMIEPAKWVTAKIAEFEARLNRNAQNTRTSINSVALLSEKRKIEVGDSWSQSQKGTRILMSSGGQSKSAGQTNPHTEHQWLNWVDRFATCMYDFWNETLQNSKGVVKQGSSDEDGLSKPVVVALIDDGVDVFDPEFSGRFIDGKTFDLQDNWVGQYYSSAQGHGTEMARLIWRVCPMASIYSIRLKTHPGQGKEHSTINAASAASAIEAALERQASVISMSWTISKPKTDKEKDLLTKVLDKACKRKVVMFCSSSDDISEDHHYPSAFNPESFLRIGAAHSDGTSWGQAGPNVDFIFPGVNVITSSGTNRPGYFTDETLENKQSTGSSIATALAAGLATMIVYCFKASLLANVTRRAEVKENHDTRYDSVRPEHLEKIAQRPQLKRAFVKMGLMPKARYITVWKRFKPVCEVFDREDGQVEYMDKLQSITDMCAELVDKQDTDT